VEIFSDVIVAVWVSMLGDVSVGVAVGTLVGASVEAMVGMLVGIMVGEAEVVVVEVNTGIIDGAVIVWVGVVSPSADLQAPSNNGPAIARVVTLINSRRFIFLPMSTSSFNLT